jgi:hypothetical protein
MPRAKQNMSWRKNLNRGIRPYVEKLVRESFLYKYEYRAASDEGKAQLWVALALISKQLDQIESKLKLFEGVLKDISPKKAVKLEESEKTKEMKAEVENIFKNIMQGKPIKPAVVKQVAKPKSRKKRK